MPEYSEQGRSTEYKFQPFKKGINKRYLYFYVSRMIEEFRGLSVRILPKISNISYPFP